MQAEGVRIFTCHMSDLNVQLGTVLAIVRDRGNSKKHQLCEALGSSSVAHCSIQYHEGDADAHADGLCVNAVPNHFPVLCCSSRCRRKGPWRIRNNQGTRNTQYFPVSQHR
mmetsp:Transcript_59502/g.118230  ORF Transcript_59502/g.118230 Transcript_59502/m.118230 type:complete len:111 (-) Transcript_59502:214-546(-)